MQSSAKGRTGAQETWASTASPCPSTGNTLQIFFQRVIHYYFRGRDRDRAVEWSPALERRNQMAGLLIA